MASFEKRSITELQLIIEKLAHMMALVDEVKTRVTCDSKLLQLHEYTIENLTYDIRSLQTQVERIDEESEIFRSEMYKKLNEIEVQVKDVLSRVCGNEQ